MSNSAFILTREIADFHLVAFPAERSISTFNVADEITDNRKVPFELFVNLVNSKTGEKTEIVYIKEWPDFLPNELAWPLFSERMYKLIQNNLSGFEGVYWLPVTINAVREQKIYYLTCFEKKLDVLNLEESKFVGSIIMYSVISVEKAKNYEIFPPPSAMWKISPLIFVSAKMRRILDSAGLAGLRYEDVRTSS